MKKLIALLSALIMCFAFTACKNNPTNNTSDTPTATVECTEQDIRTLMERNLDCYFMFYVSPLGHTTQQNSDGYFGVDEAYISDYASLKDMVYGTYTAATAERLLNHPSADTPLYKDVDGKIFMKDDVIDPVTYNIAWDDYKVEITENSTEKCSFTLTTTDFDGKEYKADGIAVNENGTWLFETIIY